MKKAIAKAIRIGAGVATLGISEAAIYANNSNKELNEVGTEKEDKAGKIAEVFNKITRGIDEFCKKDKNIETTEETIYVEDFTEKAES